MTFKNKKLIRTEAIFRADRPIYYVIRTEINENAAPIRE